MSIGSPSRKRKPKSKVVFVKVDTTEHKLFSDLAVLRHTTLSELIRQLLHRELDSKLDEQGRSTIGDVGLRPKASNRSGE